MPRGKTRRPAGNIGFAAKLVKRGYSIEEAARRAHCSTEQVRKRLGKGKQLDEGGTMTTYINTAQELDEFLRSGRRADGVPYRSKAGRELIEHRAEEIQASGYYEEAEAKSMAVSQLADEGRLVGLTSDASASAPMAGRIRELSDEDQQAQTDLGRAKKEAEQRAKDRNIEYRVALSEVMNERANSGEVAI